MVAASTKLPSNSLFSASFRADKDENEFKSVRSHSLHSLPRGRDGKAAWWPGVTGQGAVLSHVTSVHGLGIAGDGAGHHDLGMTQGTTGDRGKEAARLSWCFGEGRTRGTCLCHVLCSCHAP